MLHTVYCALIYLQLICELHNRMNAGLQSAFSSAVAVCMQTERANAINAGTQAAAHTATDTFQIMSMLL